MCKNFEGQAERDVKREERRANEGEGKEHTWQVAQFTLN